MSFGFGVGDFIAVGQLAWKVYISCKDAPESFKNISQEVLSLHAVLRETEENISAQTLSVPRQSNLKTIEDGCRNVLEDLQSLVNKYESLGTKSKRTWDRMKWGQEDIIELRSRLTSNTVLLTAFISTSQVVVEKKLDKFLRELQDGKHEGSVITTQTVESLSTDEKQAWRIVRKELEDIGITVAAFNANRGFIMDWFREGMATGVFQEQTSNDILSSQSSEDGFSQYGEDIQYPNTNQSATEISNPLNIQDLPSQGPAILEAQPNQTTTQQAISPRPVFLPMQELSTSARLSPTYIAQRATQEVYPRRKQISRVAILISWVLRYDKELVSAARRGNESKVRLMLEKGADVDAKDNEGWTALQWAARYGHEAIVKLLLEKGADVGAKGNEGWMALQRATFNGHEATVQLLLEKGADIDAKDNEGWTALQKAAFNGYEAIVQLLLEKGADVDAKDNEGWMALQRAAFNGHEAIVKLLLEKGADVDAKDNEGWTALQRATFNEHEATVQLLLEKGADVGAKNNEGWTALQMGAFRL